MGAKPTEMGPQDVTTLEGSNRPHHAAIQPLQGCRGIGTANRGDTHGYSHLTPWGLKYEDRIDLGLRAGPAAGVEIFEHRGTDRGVDAIEWNFSKTYC